MPSRALTSLLQEVFELAKKKLECVNALTGFNLIATFINTYQRLEVFCVNALTGFNLIATEVLGILPELTFGCVNALTGFNLIATPQTGCLF